MKLNQNYKAKVVEIVETPKRAVVKIEVEEAPNLPETCYPSYNLATEQGKALFERDKAVVKKGAEVQVYFTRTITSNGVKMYNGHIDTVADFFEDEDEAQAF